MSLTAIKGFDLALLMIQMYANYTKQIGMTKEQGDALFAEKYPAFMAETAEPIEEVKV